MLRESKLGNLSRINIVLEVYLESTLFHSNPSHFVFIQACPYTTQYDRIWKCPHCIFIWPQTHSTLTNFTSLSDPTMSIIKRVVLHQNYNIKKKSPFFFSNFTRSDTINFQTYTFQNVIFKMQKIEKWSKCVENDFHILVALDFRRWGERALSYSIYLKKVWNNT